MYVMSFFSLTFHILSVFKHSRFPSGGAQSFFVNQVNDVFFRFSGPNEFVIMFKWQETNGGTKTHVRC